MTHRPDLGRLLALLEPVRVLDAYCCIGGAAKGYRRAFGNCHITGVDHETQPDYCGDAFHQADAIEYIRAHGHEYDFIHASPPARARAHRPRAPTRRATLRSAASTPASSRRPGPHWRPRAGRT